MHLECVSERTFAAQDLIAFIIKCQETEIKLHLIIFPTKEQIWSINPSHLFSLVMCLEYIYICHIIWLTLPVFQSKPFDSCYRIHFFDMYVRAPGSLPGDQTKHECFSSPVYQH